MVTGPTDAASVWPAARTSSREPGASPASVTCGSNLGVPQRSANSAIRAPRPPRISLAGMIHRSKGEVGTSVSFLLLARLVSNGGRRVRQPGRGAELAAHPGAYLLGGVPD